MAWIIQNCASEVEKDSESRDLRVKIRHMHSALFALAWSQSQAATATVQFAPLLCLTVSLFAIVKADDPYRFFNWNVTYGDIYPLGVRQQGILINGQFPGPDIHSVTNDNLIINVFNSLKEPFLISW
ncbi:hypothetical protein Patl1_09446 [Pistacia atlantica]|uniref:Uncharacterized protein n=1 Tax=Pistacia atlantica TaxID=434234 RepID=A0ACC1AH06_9ROSI|nr:hypothetical protein Patl1_09446 [Pistacia atlantica]